MILGTEKVLIEDSILEARFLKALPQELHGRWREEAAAAMVNVLKGIIGGGTDGAAVPVPAPTPSEEG